METWWWLSNRVQWLEDSNGNLWQQMQLMQMQQARQMQQLQAHLEQCAKQAALNCLEVLKEDMRSELSTQRIDLSKDMEAFMNSNFERCTQGLHFKYEKLEQLCKANQKELDKRLSILQEESIQHMNVQREQQEELSQSQHGLKEDFEQRCKELHTLVAKHDQRIEAECSPRPNASPTTCSSPEAQSSEERRHSLPSTGAEGSCEAESCSEEQCLDEMQLRRSQALAEALSAIAKVQDLQKRMSMVEASYKNRIIEIYQRRNPSKLKELDQLVDKYGAAEMYKKICKKYSEPALPELDLVQENPALVHDAVQDLMFLPHQSFNGGFGTVQIAASKATGCRYAVKSSQHILLQEQEAAILRQVQDHPHIVRFFFEWKNQTDHYLVMEHLPSTLQSKFPFTMEQAAFFGRCLVSAVSHLDSLGVVHLDLKPENMMFDQQGVLRLIDFGLARHKLFSKSKGFEAVGTPLSMAPEVITGEGFACADLWGIGVCLFEFVTAKKPFSSLQEVLKATPALPDGWKSSPGLSLASRLLQRDPKQRPGFSDIAADGFFNEQASSCSVNDGLLA